jgi:hypothetical protein
MVMDILQEIMDKLVKTKLDPVSATMHGGYRLFMERINGTTKYLSNNKTMIYDVTFADTYKHTGKIPEDHFAVENYLLKVESWAHIDNPEEFLRILNLEYPKVPGTRFYLDNILFMENVPFIKADLIRNELLNDRYAGIRTFRCLKIVDIGGNITEFFASKEVQRRKAAENV